MFVLGTGAQAGITERVGAAAPADGEGQPGDPSRRDQNVRTGPQQPDREHRGGARHHGMALPKWAANLLVEHVQIVPTGYGVLLRERSLSGHHARLPGESPDESRGSSR